MPARPETLTTRWRRPLRQLAVGLLLCLATSPSFAQKESVNPGINKSYENPDVGEFLERFENEGREVYDRRQAIVEATGVQPGMEVADIGAGTGLFTRMFAREVGDQGKVYAVDIAKNFVDYIERTAREQGLKNVEAIVGEQDDVLLPKDSIDLAFICDTYHHFEYPQRTMQSIHKALRPGGRVVVVDFHRIEGESSDWILNHVRAGKETFVKEIQDAGFKLSEEQPDVPLEANYIVVFQRR